MIYHDQTSSAMNYYEELGVAPDATELEIRKAHRRLVKLMHPDAQPDQNLKMLAETQMRRLNSIVSTLVDPEQRRSYDEHLYLANNPVYRQPAQSGWRGIPWWLASAVGAVVLTLAAVWLWADHLGSNFGGKTKVIYVAQEPSGVASIPVERTPQDSDPPSSEIGSASYVPPRPENHELNSSTPVLPDEEKPKPHVITENHPAPPAPSPSDASNQTSKPIAPTAAVKTPPAKVADAKPPVPLAVDSRPLSSVPINRPQSPILIAKATPPDLGRNSAVQTAVPDAAPKKMFYLPAGNVIARAQPPSRTATAQIPAPPGGVIPPVSKDIASGVLPASSLPTAIPPPKPASTVSTGAGIGINPRDPLEGEWVYAPKEPEKRKVGFYPPEFIDLKLFGAGDPGNLHGQYSAKYVVTDRPVASEVTFELASVSKGSRKFVWQGNNGAKGTFSIDPIDDRTIRIDWRTTSAVRGPALTSGTATLVRRQ